LIDAVLIWSVEFKQSNDKQRLLDYYLVYQHLELCWQISLRRVWRTNARA